MAELVLEVAAKAIAAKTEVNLFILFPIEGYSVAGKRAGLTHVDIINEPVSAALCFVLGTEGAWFVVGRQRSVCVSLRTLRSDRFSPMEYSRSFRLSKYRKDSSTRVGTTMS